MLPEHAVWVTLVILIAVLLAPQPLSSGNTLGVTEAREPSPGTTTLNQPKRFTKYVSDGQNMLLRYVAYRTEKRCNAI